MCGFYLLKPDRLGRSDFSDQIGGADHHQQGDEEGADIQQDDVERVQLYRYGREVVGGGIEFEYLPPVLDKAE